MNYAEELKQKLNTNSTDPITAVIYARVSTDNESQKESCANQVELAMNYITNHPAIRLLDTYVDDGISGKNDFTRTQYNNMLQQISTGSIDLVITKSLSRLNRDELNSFQLGRLLVNNDATVLTLEDNQIHDFQDPNSSLVHSLSFAIDAQYVMKQSINGKKTHELRCERKELSAKDTAYGYDWIKEDKSITINQEQASIIVEIFEGYVYRNGTPASLHKYLKTKGVDICSRTISNIIKDERYIGNFYINKRSSKLGTGQTKTKRIILTKENWILVKRPDLQIIDRDLFEMAQQIHQTRIKVYTKPDKASIQARFQGIHKFAGKIFCPDCGKSYQFGYADRQCTTPIYRIKSHSDCPNPVNRISETAMEEITQQALRKIFEQQLDVCTMLEQTLINCVKQSRNNGNEIEKLKNQRVTKEKKIDSLVDTLSEGGLTDSAKERLKSKINSLTYEIDQLTRSITDKESNRLDDSYVTNKIQEIHDALTELKNFTTMDRERILNYVDRIELPASGDINITLKSGQMLTINLQNQDSYKTVGKIGIQDALYS